MTTDTLAGDEASTLDAGSSPTVTDTYGTTQTFESLGVTLALTKALANQGITTAFPIQALTIADALAGRDVCGKAKTGSGKTLAFGLPLLQRTEASLRAASTPPAREGRRTARPRALVLLPTRELAVQVHDVLAPLAVAVGLRIVAVYGGADIDRQVATLRKGVDVIIATPGRLIDLEIAVSCRSPASRRSCSTRPTGWPTWDSCPRWNGCCAVSSSHTRPSCSQPRSTVPWTGWSSGTSPTRSPTRSRRAPRRLPQCSTVSCRSTRWTR